jgi:hypothetical protein
MTRFVGAAQHDGHRLLGYEETLNALHTMIGRPVLVLFSGTAGDPFIAGVVAGRLDRGELDRRLAAILLRNDAARVETLFFHVGSRESGFVLRPDEFDRGFWQEDGQLTIHLRDCAVTVMIQGELGEALTR